MIESVQFKNFKVLRDATLPLGRFTLIVGPNGSGKSTALQAFHSARHARSLKFTQVASADLLASKERMVWIRLRWGRPKGTATTVFGESDALQVKMLYEDGKTSRWIEDWRQMESLLDPIRTYSLDADRIAGAVNLNPKMELTTHGGNLAGVLDRLRDQDPERFELLNEELGRWFPEFDRVLFDTPSQGQRAFLLRTRRSHCKIPATDLSQGTLMALALLTLAYLPEPPPLVCLEEPDRGIHPRLLRRIQDALYRLSYSEDFGEKREPVQVIATTHSPYFLDLYKDHPEEIVIAQKTEDGARFERLSEQPQIMEILGDAPLGEVWYSGILGGVPAEQ